MFIFALAGFTGPINKEKLTMKYYRIHDNPDIKSGAIETPLSQCDKWNVEGWGIFWCVNDFKSRRRLSELTKINYWYVDLDDGSKASQWARIEQSPAIPSMVIETKRGFHIYWKAENGTRDNWSRIMKDRLIPFFNGDQNATDITRLLRAPGFYHMKDKANPFWVDFAFGKENSFSEKEMITLFPDACAAARIKKEKHFKDLPLTAEGRDAWEKIWNLDCEIALSKLSGSLHVGGENYTFRDNRNGTKQIYVNGKSTACWIDADKHIGSHSNGGPTVAQWLRWFGISWRQTIEILEKEFPNVGFTSDFNSNRHRNRKISQRARL